MRKADGNSRRTPSTVLEVNGHHRKAAPKNIERSNTADYIRVSNEIGGFDVFIK